MISDISHLSGPHEHRTVQYISIVFQPKEESHRHEAEPDIQIYIDHLMEQNTLMFGRSRVDEWQQVLLPTGRPCMSSPHIQSAHHVSSRRSSLTRRLTQDNASLALPLNLFKAVLMTDYRFILLLYISTLERD